ncbi:MAG: phosphate acyltransferase PlsX [Verrucomicrobiales bacterium]
MKIAIDAMGGDFAPENIVGGAKLALESIKRIDTLYLTGPEAELKKIVDAQGLPASKVEIVDAPELVEMNESGAKAVRRKKRSSISVATDLVKHGTCSGVMSAGNTGAAVAAATVKLRNLPGVERAGIASPLPNEHGTCNIIDAGANPDAKANHLLQYGIMGSVYAKYALGVDSPRIGLMSVGTEDEKGTEFTREVFGLLKDSHLNFIGNVEGHDLFEKPVDVIVCDGFVGNVVLKSCEGTAYAMFKWLKQELTVSPLRMLGAKLAKGAFRSVKKRASAESYGGCPLLGVNGVCIIAHGSSTPTAAMNAIRIAVEAVSHEVNPHIEEEIARHNVPSKGGENAAQVPANA